MYMRIVLGSDHAGFEMKQNLVEFVRSLGHEILDVGAFSTQPSDYPDFADAVGKAVIGQQAERGILICGSGVGASVAANKVIGIRAGLCHDCYSAHQGVEHDGMNVLVMGSRIIGLELAHDVVKRYLDAQVSDEARHVRRRAKIAVMEQNACNPPK